MAPRVPGPGSPALRAGGLAAWAEHCLTSQAPTSSGCPDLGTMGSVFPAARDAGPSYASPFLFPVRRGGGASFLVPPGFSTFRVLHQLANWRKRHCLP